MGGPEQSTESLRNAMAYGKKKKTAESVHRARNWVTGPEVAETMGQLEERYRSWKKDILGCGVVRAGDHRSEYCAVRTYSLKHCFQQLALSSLFCTQCLPCLAPSANIRCIGILHHFRARSVQRNAIFVHCSLQR